ncbi:ribbon-helix-helix protein, CopG family [Corynebacterium diphtheriae]|uniref:ribbon-helix-helix protein, CopG family n=1 Tax=Corynebacterium diphtheriae TaxID=1717 RepID=UPI0002468192|nr:ribbon-helix-helix domain-containing protein [Corynebacterium diphtheriae]AEX68056.1 hypothetical protein CDC7B_1865 [Corynebacterium diphtheriae C7 (beta)]ERA52016.1 hypothetical protein B178_08392 [Corynebacterium diphtheriae DSM 43988]AEX72765.1 hypothetical protein CDCE8392_1779 [Corynebacterium diphtheriae CDCE 8392]APM35998.1 hypothetical protein BS112_05365 [Corynebacterium diphtheriae]MBG9222634.1 ribbon-helix-helix protein, CopG family [Corynebacterium diphtheriae bv. mitis]
MATTKKKQWAGRGPVTSVRVDPELVDRLDALAKRTGRSRGAYLRMALWAMLPQLDEDPLGTSRRRLREHRNSRRLRRNHPPLHGASHRRLQTTRQ